MRARWLAMAILVSACTAETPPAPPPPHAAVVEMTEGPDFVPNQLTIHVGETVVWHNGSRFGHTVTFDPAHAEQPDAVSLPRDVAPFDSGRIEPGASYWHTFTVPGTYDYVCVPHQEFGMVGEIEVKP